MNEDAYFTAMHGDEVVGYLNLKFAPRKGDTLKINYDTYKIKRVTHVVNTKYNLEGVKYLGGSEIILDV